MKTPKSYFGMLGLWLGLLPSAFAQTGKVAIGLDYGPSIIRKGPESVLYSLFAGIGSASSGTLIPKNIRARIELGLSPSAVLRLSAGYGFTREETRFAGTFTTPDNPGSNQFRTGARFTVSGFPAEGALIFRLPLDNGGKLATQFGLGGGFYSYQSKAEAFQEVTGRALPEGSRREKYAAPETKLSGFAQFFLAGLDARINARVRVTFELSKLGYSWLKEKRDEEYELSGVFDNPIQYMDTREDHHNAGSGFDDVALSLGLSLNL